VPNKEDVKSAFQLAKNLRPVFGHSPKEGSQNSGNVVESTRISSPELIDSAVHWS